MRKFICNTSVMTDQLSDQRVITTCTYIISRATYTSNIFLIKTVDNSTFFVKK